MAALRGKVVLLRWWTDGCPFCEATAPALRKLNSTFQSKGLEVIGVYHPKPAKKGDLQKVRQAVLEKQFSFPVAVDWDWSALRRWWLFQDRRFTSVSFLVDRQGRIRYIQPGGEYHEGEQGGMPTHASCQRDFAVIRKTVEQLLIT
jgi:peroxiredoxin